MASLTCGSMTTGICEGNVRIATLDCIEGNRTHSIHVH